MSRVGDEAKAGAGPGAVAPPPVVYAAGLAVGLGLEAALPATSLPAALAWSLGGALLLGGLVLAASFLAAFRRARTPVDLRKASTTVVTTGPYRFTRNPGYLSLTLIYAGLALLTQALWAFLPLVAVLLFIDRGVIRREERYLAGRFGDEYLRYQVRTRRWV